MLNNRTRDMVTKKIESLDKTTLRQLISSVIAILSMTGRVTMLSISRWSSMSYKTVGRFLDKRLDWLKLNYSMIKDDIEELQEVNSAKKNQERPSGKNLKELKKISIN